MKNLDYLAAKYGQAAGFATPPLEESTINDALDILHGQGIYALFLWLYEKPKAEERGHIGKQIQLLFKDQDAPVPVDGVIWTEGADRDNALTSVRKSLTENLKTMFLAKELISLTLTYARHAAKARPSKEEKPHG